jgi:hypothetical protein
VTRVTITSAVRYSALVLLAGLIVAAVGGDTLALALLAGVVTFAIGLCAVLWRRGGKPT